MAKQDDIAAQYYEDPANLQVAGPPQRLGRTGAQLSNHIPIRFSAAAIAKVKYLADEDGLTVSSWVRRLVERELERRLSSRNATSSSVQAPAQIQVSEQQAETLNGLGANTPRLVLRHQWG